MTLENLGMRDPFIFQCGLRVKSMESDGLAVLAPSLILSVGKSISLYLIFSSIKQDTCNYWLGLW